MDGFWGEMSSNEERYYSDSFIKYVIVIEGFNECVLFPAMAARFMFEVAMDPVQLSFFTLKPKEGPLVAIDEHISDAMVGHIQSVMSLNEAREILHPSLCCRT